MEVLLAIGIAMFAGLFLSRLTSKLNLPDVTSYLVAGLLVGPLCLGKLGVPGLGLTSFEAVEELGLLTDVALGFIAFSIGSEFRVSALRKIGLVQSHPDSGKHSKAGVYLFAAALLITCILLLLVFQGKL